LKRPSRTPPAHSSSNYIRDFGPDTIEARTDSTRPTEPPKNYIRDFGPDTIEA